MYSYFEIDAARWDGLIEVLHMRARAPVPRRRSGQSLAEREQWFEKIAVGAHPLEHLPGVEAHRSWVSRLRTINPARQHSTSVPEALGILSDWPAELMISDIGMPGQDGYCLVRELRDHPNSSICYRRAIALTAFAREQDRKEALDAGFNEHLSKLVRAATLLEKVARVSGRA